MLERYNSNEKKATRQGFGDALAELGNEHQDVVALCADLTGSLKMNAFEKAHPERFFQAGISEANMMGVAAGLATSGFVPFAGTFANFATGRVYDQIRQSIAYSDKNVKICASHAGLTLGEDGATHQILEDLGLMQMLPGMCVINPCDYNQTKAATKAIYAWKGPVYLRFGRPSWPVFMPENGEFEIGKAIQMKAGSDITIIATGHLVWHCVEAVKELESRGVSCELINIHTIKPLDEEAIIKSARKTGKVLVAEEHQELGGLGSSVATCLAKNHSCPMDFISVKDSFGESGKPDQLLDKYGLGIRDVVSKAMSLIK